jgi:pantoate--beta-alanine ligase
LKIIQTVSAFEAYISEKKKNRCIGFVPTMGALHHGHGSLVLRAKKECDEVVVSIFVNPTQFNNQNDFDKYPITVEKDLKYLEELKVDMVFLPSIDEIYPSSFKMPAYNIGKLDLMMEGKHRPGHFKGVVQVVYRLFEIVKPDKAYFGLKDFQQVMVIKQMINFFKLPIEIVPCTTIREDDGLAMSSRNLRLTPEQRTDALFIFKSLQFAQSQTNKMIPRELKYKLEEHYKSSRLRLEYVEFIDPNTFEILNDRWVSGAVACIVAYVGDIRLIDNMAVTS